MPEKECYTVLVLQFFQNAVIKTLGVSDAFGPPAVGRPLEEVIGTQALEVDLRVAETACLETREALPTRCRKIVSAKTTPYPRHTALPARRQGFPVGLAARSQFRLDFSSCELRDALRDRRA